MNRIENVDVPARGAPGARLRLLAAVAALGLLVSLPAQVVFAQAPTLRLDKEVLGGEGAYESGATVTYLLPYTCSSIMNDCEAPTVTDVLPPDIEFVSAVKTADIESIDFDGGSNTVTFNFFDPLPAGSTGILKINVRFPPGTDPGTPAVNEATFDATNAVEVTSNEVTITADGVFEMFAEKTVGEVVRDVPTDFTLSACSPDSTGGVELTNPIITDTLPAGATFVSASGGDFTYLPGTNQVVFGNPANGDTPLPDIPVGGCTSFTVTVVFDTIPAGDATNDLDISGTPQGCEGGGGPLPPHCNGVAGPIGIPPDSVDFPVIVPYADGGGAKSADTPSTFNEPSTGSGDDAGGQVVALLGETVSYSVSAENTGYLTFTNVSVTDTIPVEIELDSFTTGALGAGQSVEIFYQINDSGTWLPVPGSPFASTTTISVGSLGLASGEEVTDLRWDLGFDLPPESSWSAAVFGAVDNDPGLFGVTFPNCSGFSADFTDDNGDPQSINTNSCANVRVIEPRAIPRPRKSGDAGPHLPEDFVDMTVRVTNDAVAHIPITNPVLADLLPPELRLITTTVQYNSAASKPGAPAPNIEIIDNYSSTGQTLLLLKWIDESGSGGTDATVNVAPGEELVVDFTVQVVEQTPPGRYFNKVALIEFETPGDVLGCTGSLAYTDTLDLNMNGDTTEVLCQNSDGEGFADVNVSLQMESEKFVKGALDPDFNKLGLTYAGGPLDYRLVITNTANVTTTNLYLVDILPFVGDTGVIDTSPRGSQWRPNLQGAVIPNAVTSDGDPVPLTIRYSNKQNPCRPEVNVDGPAGCVPPMWRNNVGSDPTAVQALELDFCEYDVNGDVVECLVLDIQEAVILEWPMVAPNDAPEHPSCLADPFVLGDNPDCQIAWNSFGFSAEGGGLVLRPAEPIRVGIRVGPDDTNLPNLGDFVFLDVHGQQDDGIQQPEEPGINGVRVELWDPGPDGDPDTADDVQILDGGGDPVYRITGPDDSGEPGYYEFADLTPDDYFLKFFPPPGYTTSPGAPEGSPIGGDEGLDSDGIGAGNDPTFGDYVYTDPVTLVSGVDNYDVDQGMWLPTDYGDAPYAPGGGDLYPTQASLLGNPADAARHIIRPYITMGATVDAELDGAPQLDAFGDDQAGSPDDEDAVTWPDYLGTLEEPIGVLVLGETATVDVQVTYSTTLPANLQNAFLVGWIDWNGDGIWDPSEQVVDEIVTDGTVGSTISIPVNIPSGATPGTAHARFRFSTTPNLDWTGTANDGEIEDYQVQLISAPQKSIVETSEDHTSEMGPAPVDLAIGEIVRYRLQVSIPEAVVPGVVVTDNLPAGLIVVSGSATVTLVADGSLAAPSAPIMATPAGGGGFADGVDPVFDLGTLTNDDADADEEFAIIEFDALVLNDAANQAGDDLTNDFDVSWTTFARTSNEVDANLIEPVVDLTKTATTEPLDAGDTVVYEIVASHPGGADTATAFELRITDTLDADLDLTAATIAVPGYATSADNSVIGSNIVDFSVDELRAGDSATVVVTATVLAAAENGLTIPNTAYLRYTSLPDEGSDPNDTQSTTPGVSGEADGERNGDDGPGGSPNDYADTASAPVTLLAPSVDKLAPSPVTATIGEVVTWTIAVSLPEGTTSGLVVTDTLPAGLVAVSTEVVTTAADSGGLLAADYSGTLPTPTTSTSAGDGNDVEWDFGDVVTPADNDGTNNRFLLRVVTRVENVLSNQNGTNLENRALLGYEDPDAPGPLTEVPDPDPETMTVVEPILGVDKTIATPPDPADAGGTVVYQVVLAHTGDSAADAFDAVFTDTIPAALENASIDSVTASPIAAPSAEIASGELRVPTAADGSFDLPQDAVVTVTFRADIVAGVAPFQTITNTGVITWTTLDGEDPNERTAGDGPLDGGGLNDYENDGSVAFDIDPPGLDKVLETTSAGHTAGRDVTIGEVVTYTLAITLPEGITPSMTITDDLPAGMAYVPGSAGADYSGFNGTPTSGDPVVSTSGSGGDGDDLVLDFGPISTANDNDPSNNAFLVRYAAVVLNVPGNVGLPPSRTDLANTASIVIGGNPPVSDTETVTVAEPDLEIAKDIDKDATWPNDTVRITLVVTNTGTSDAFDVIVEDPISTTLFSALAPVTTPAGFNYATTTSGPNTLVIFSGGSIPAGQSRTFEFDLTLSGDLAPSPPDVFNEATVTQATTLDSNADDGDDTQERDEPDVSDDDSLTIIVPEIELTKTDNFDTVVPGQSITYTLTVTNNGTAPAVGVVITETVPANTTFDPATSSFIWISGGPPCPPGAPAGTVCTFDVNAALGGELPANGGSFEVVFGVNVNPTLPQGTSAITNTAVASDDGTRGNDPVPGNNDAQHIDAVLTDYSDNPDTYGTTNTTNGAVHYIDGMTFLGALVDPESDGFPTVDALGDDRDGAPDDEDGVVFDSPIMAGEPATITVTAAADGFLNAWVDFDGDGAFDPGEQIATDTPLTAGANTIILTAPAAVSDTLYTRFRMTSYDTGGSLGPDGVANDGEVEDYVLMSLGNRVFLDNGIGGGLGDNGIQDGAEAGIPGVVVELYREGDTPGVDDPIATTTTDGNGDYLFTGLTDDDYVVHLPAENFDPAAPLEGLLSSVGAGDPNDPADQDVDENGIDASDPATTGITTGSVRLDVGQEPTGEDGNPNTNLTIDLGLIESDYGDLPEGPYATTDGVNGARHIIDGVTFLGAGVDAEPDGAPSALADGDDLAAPGDDEDGIVFLDPILSGERARIQVTANVSGYLNAFIDFDGDGVLDTVDVLAASPGANIPGTGDLNDLQITAGGVYTITIDVPAIPITTSLYSRFRYTTGSGEATDPTGLAPNGEVEDYLLLSLGNRVFFDDGTGGGVVNDGAQTGTEPGVPGVVVELYRADQTPGSDLPIGSTTTDAAGNYIFTGLNPGDYVVHIPAGEFAPTEPLEGYFSSQGSGATTDPFDQDVDENGIDSVSPTTTGISSAPVNLTPGGEPDGEDGDPNSDLTIDFGFTDLGFDFGDLPDGPYPTLLASNGAYHVIDSRTFLGAGVDNEADGQPSDAADGDDTNATDDGDGIVFLTPITQDGTAQIQVTASVSGYLNAWFDFDGDGVLDTVDVTGASGGATIPGSGLLNDLQLPAGGVYTLTIDVPDVPITTSLYSRFRFTEGADQATDFTGVAINGEVEDYVLGAIGNRVFADYGAAGTANDGAQTGGEPGIPGVTVELLDGAGNVIETTTTDGNGDYLFTGLPSGDYYVNIPADQFQPGGPLEGLTSSTDGPTSTDPNADIDQPLDENGVDVADPTTTGISTTLISLLLGAAPVGEDGDANSNLAVDFGMVQQDLGDLPDAYGTTLGADGARHILDGVTFLGAGVDPEADGVPSDDADGDDLAAPGDDEDGVTFLSPIMPGDVFTISVEASTDSFLNAWIDFDSDGVISPFEQIAADTSLSPGANVLSFTAPVSTTGSIYSRFRVSADAGDVTSPTGPANSGEVEDYVLLALGNRVFLDDASGGATADDGAQGGTEPGIPGVVVELYLDGQTPGVDSPIATTTTDGNGDYLFTGLNPDEYVVFLPQENFASSAPLEGLLSSTGAGAPNDDLDQDVDEHGLDDPDPAANGIVAAPIELSLGGEPDGNGNVNLTLDFGLVGYDRGDLPDVYGTTIGAGGASHVIDGTFLGAGVDAESDGQPSAAADGDDTLSTDDEDGVTFLAPLTPGTSVDIQIVAGTAGFLNGFIDFDGDGTLDPVTVSAASGGAVIPFSGLMSDLALPSPGTYTITIDVPAGVSPTSVYSRFRYTTESGQATSPVGPAPTGEVEDYVLGSIGNRVFLDDGTGGGTLADGAQNGGEPGVPGVVVELLVGGSVVATTTTNASGDYFFGGLPTDDYQVRIPASEFQVGEPLFGYASSPDGGSPADPNADIDQDADENGIDSIDPPTTGLTTGTINLAPGTEPTSEDGDANSNLTVDFGVVKRDLGDLPEVYGTTDATNGASHVIDDVTFLGAGVDAESDGQPSPAADGDDTAAGDDEDGIVFVDPLMPGQPARIQVTASTAGYLSAFFDFDNDGSFDPVPVLAASPGVVAPPVGDPFSDVQITSGGVYTITIDVPPTVSTTVYNRFRFAADPGEASTPTGDANSGEVEDYLLGSLGNRVWLDDGLGGGGIANGAQDGSEAGIPGVTVELYAAGQTPGSDTPLATTTTDGTGDYLFTGLVDGDYIVHLPGGNFDSGQPLFELFSTPGSGDPEGGIDQNLDENGLDELDPPSTGISSAVVNLTVGSETTTEDGDPNSDLTIDFAFVEGVTIGNYVWEDLNGNGEQDEPPSAGVNGVLVTAIDATTGLPVDDPNNPGNPLQAVTMDDGFGNPGYYLFAGLDAGNYAVEFDYNTLPPGTIPTTQDAPGVSDDLDSDPDPVTGRTPPTGPLIQGDVDFSLDLGIIRPAHLAGDVWLDADGDGTREGGEPGIGDVTVTLFRDDDGVPGPSAGDTPIDIAVTDPDGGYSFDDLPPGPYYVDVDETTIPAGLTPTIGASDPTAVQNLGPGDSVDDLEIGYRLTDPTTSGIGDRVWYDQDGDGIQDPGEPGIPGVRVLVQGPSGVFEVFTDPNGMWWVPGLQPGEYTATVDPSTLPPDFGPIPTNGAIGRTLLLPAGSAVLYGDFGFDTDPANVGSIGDTVFLDGNGDGTQDPGDPGVPGVTLTLIDEGSGAQVAVTTTGPDGSYSFNDLLPGTYTVIVTDHADVLGTLGRTTPLPPTQSIVIGPGDDYVDADFGYGSPAGPAGPVAGLIGTTIWHDLNGDGVRDPGESGIEGVQVDLWRDIDGNGILDPGTDMLFSSTTTNAFGEYLFNNLPFDDFLVDVDESSSPLLGMSKTSGAPATNDNSQADPYATTLTPASPADLRADFGYQSDSGNPISGVVFVDNNNDGDFDFGVDTRIPRIPVSLYQDTNGNGILDPGEPKVGMTETSEDPGTVGEYEFPDMPDGDYIVVAEANGTRLEGYFQTTQTGTNGMEPVELLGAPSPDHNFGFRAPGGSQTNPVTIARFGSELAGDVLRITWTTASEAANAGFDIYVETADGTLTRLNEQLVPTASSDAFGPQDYVLEVPLAALGAEGAAAIAADASAATLWIEDLDLRGEARRHGPFTFRSSAGDELGLLPIDWPTISAEHAELGVARTAELAEDATAQLDALRAELAAEGLDADGLAALLPGAGAFDDDAGSDATAEGEISSDGDLLATDPALAARFVDALSRADAGGALADVTVDRAGLVRVTHDELAASGADLLGLPTALLAVTLDGRAISRQIEGPALWSSESALVFHGQARESIYGEDNVYRVSLDLDAAVGIATEDGTPAEGVAAEPWYLETVEINDDLGYAPGAPGDDPWYAAQLLARGEPQEQTFALRVDGLVDTTEVPAVLRVDLWGVTDWPANDADHHVELILNEVVVADEVFDGVVERRVTVPLEPGMLLEGGNALTVGLPGDTGERYDMVALDRYGLSYPRAFEARDGGLTFTASGEVFEVRGLATDDVVVLRHRHGDVVRLSGVEIAESSVDDETGEATYVARFAGTADAASYTVVERDALGAARAVAPARRATTAALLAEEADYIAISHGSFVEGLDELVAAREAEGLSVRVVDVADVYAAYGDAQFGADPIDAFISDAHTQLSTQYVLLVGGDTYDYRDRLGVASMSFVPSPYGATGELIRHAPVDPLYGDVDGDGVPEVAVGRFPVRTVAELEAVVGKTLAYGEKDYGRTAVFAADEIDRGVSYADASDGFVSGLPEDWRVERAYLDDVGVASARATLLQAIDEGVALVTYAGHSQADAWGFDGLFDGGDAAALENAERPTVVTQWGCWNTYHVAPRYDTMGHRLLLSGDRGAAAVLGSATLSQSASDARLGGLVTPAITEPGARLGAAVTTAKQELADTHPEDVDVILGWTLLGDPALVIEDTVR